MNKLGLYTNLNGVSALIRSTAKRMVETGERRQKVDGTWELKPESFTLETPHYTEHVLMIGSPQPLRIRVPREYPVDHADHPIRIYDQEHINPWLKESSKLLLDKLRQWSNDALVIDDMLIDTDDKERCPGWYGAKPTEKDYQIYVEQFITGELYYEHHEPRFYVTEPEDAEWCLFQINIGAGAYSSRNYVLESFAKIPGFVGIAEKNDLLKKVILTVCLPIDTGIEFARGRGGFGRYILLRTVKDPGLKQELIDLYRDLQIWENCQYLMNLNEALLRLRGKTSDYSREEFIQKAKAIAPHLFRRIAFKENYFTIYYPSLLREYSAFNLDKLWMMERVESNLRASRRLKTTVTRILDEFMSQPTAYSGIDVAELFRRLDYLPRYVIETQNSDYRSVKVNFPKALDMYGRTLEYWVEYGRCDVFIDALSQLKKYYEACYCAWSALQNDYERANQLYRHQIPR